MKLVLPIDPFNLTQGFGENPQAYAQFGLKGHNGWDIKTKYSDTPDGKRGILAPQDADFYKKGDEGTKGFGRYIEILTTTSKTKWKHTFAHCDSVDNFIRRNQGDKIAVSDNTGNSTGAHLHWTVKRMNSDGTVKDNNNGYFGAVNPQEYVDEVRADINNSNSPPMPQLPKDLENYRIDWKEIAVAKGLDVNSTLLAPYKAIDQIISNKLKDQDIAYKDQLKKLQDENETLQRVNLEYEKVNETLGQANTELEGKLADCVAKCQDGKYNSLITVLSEVFSKAREVISDVLKQVKNNGK